MAEKVNPTSEKVASVIPEQSDATVTPLSQAPKKNNFAPVIIMALVICMVIVGLVWFSSQSKNTDQQKTAQVYRVGVLSALDYFLPAVDSFKQSMTELGYIEGENIVYDVQKGPAPVGNQEIIKQFVADNVDLILVFPTEASLEAKEITKESGIPIISIAAFMEGNGLIESISRPGGNLTGVRFPIREVAAKRLEILHELIPEAKRIWIPYLKDYPTVAPAIEALQPVVESFGLTLVEAPFSTPDEMTEYFSTRETGDIGMDAIVLIPEPVSIIPAFAEQTYVFADTHAIPIAGVSLLDSDHGPIFSLIPSSVEFGRLAAPLADKIFKGIPAGDIPVVTPESEFEINYLAIQKLGLTASEGLLLRAKKIIR